MFCLASFVRSVSKILFCLCYVSFVFLMSSVWSFSKIFFSFQLCVFDNTEREIEYYKK